MHIPLISFLTELWHFLDVSALEGHGAVLAALLLLLDITISRIRTLIFAGRYFSIQGQELNFCS